MFSVEAPTRPAGATPSELVPSRYALQVGDIDVLVVSDGVLPLPTATMATNVDPAELANWLQRNFLPPDMFDWPLNVMVARSGQQTILVDAGLGSQFPGFPRAGQFPRRLEDAGIPLETVTDVVVTHMHMDHVGGLLAAGVKERLRPDVRIHVARAEVDFWTQPDFTHTDMPKPVPNVLRSTAKSFADTYRDNLCIFEERHEVAPGVVVRLTGGHTEGHSVVDLSSKGEWLTFAGDAMFPVGFENPGWHNGFEHDPVASASVRRGLFEQLADNGGLLVAAHLPFPSVGRVAREGDAFRYVPVIWDF
ncbi:MBL fold metallo-hydrolase [Pseudorhodoferax sp. Leaf265]|uniref:MBL fold metallo-hydrolase n=1 Tax=Pseudorhodoferax sp. Leaf265 TaxID=1736315 RepID=UPI000700E9B3|nr:MBL fold metallo-hydrolase [Pseudorhodoferax sp. Leaf265]KQP21078.1 MBL fold metallo-hydrolase [Pseudorhodoferax sp. Leaf265]